MKTPASNIYKIGCAVVGSAAMASLSAYITTKYLLKMALDREEPKLMKLAEKKVSGSIGNTEFARALATSGKRLAAKPNETVEIIAHDGETLVGHWIPCENPERIILAVHGWRASWHQTFGLVSEAWEQNHCNALYVEQRGTNNSGGDTISFGLISALTALTGSDGSPLTSKRIYQSICAVYLWERLPYSWQQDLTSRQISTESLRTAASRLPTQSGGMWLTTISILRLVCAAQSLMRC